MSAKPAFRMIPNDPRQSVVKWQRCRGKDADVPDDEITVLCGWSEDQTVTTGFISAGVWRGEESACKFEPPPDWWAHTPEVPPEAKP